MYYCYFSIKITFNKTIQRELSTGMIIDRFISKITRRVMILLMRMLKNCMSLSKTDLFIAGTERAVLRSSMI